MWVHKYFGGVISKLMSYYVTINTYGKLYNISDF